MKQQHDEVAATLIDAAWKAAEQAYAPYSGYKVGAAILDADGRVWTGANVENRSYGASLCAERAAIAKMVSAGSREISLVAVVTEDGAPPCGICLQTLLEFAPNPEEVRVLLANDAGPTADLTLQELTPYGFRSARVQRTHEP